MNMNLLGMLLLLVAGMMNALPPLGKALTDVTGGTPVIQIAIGIACILVSIVTFVKRSTAS